MASWRPSECCLGFFVVFSIANLRRRQKPHSQYPAQSRTPAWHFLAAPIASVTWIHQRLLQCPCQPRWQTLTPIHQSSAPSAMSAVHRPQYLARGGGSSGNLDQTLSLEHRERLADVSACVNSSGGASQNHGEGFYRVTARGCDLFRYPSQSQIRGPRSWIQDDRTRDWPDGCLYIVVHIWVMPKNVNNAVARDLAPSHLQFKRLYRADLRYRSDVVD
jgi:hypothetical protein